MKTAGKAQSRRERTLAKMPGLAGAIFLKLYDELIRANWAHQTLVELFGSGESTLKLLRSTAPSFFGDLRVVLGNDLLLRLTRLMDPPRTGAKRNASIPALLDELRTQARPNRRLLARVSKRLEQAFLVAENLKRARNLKVAHNDLVALGREPEYSSSNVVRVQVESLLAVLGDVLATVEDHYLSGRTEFSDVGRVGGAKALLRWLERGWATRPPSREP